MVHILRTQVDSARWPCCGRRIRIDFGPNESVERRCRFCKRRFRFRLEPALCSGRLVDELWRVVVEPV